MIRYTAREFSWKNRVTDGSDPYAPYYRKGSAASHISKAEIDALDLTDVELIHVTGIPPRCQKAQGRRPSA